MPSSRSAASKAARNIAKYRRALNLTQAQLAEKIAVEKVSVSRMETGKIIPSLERLEQIANALGCSVVDLLRDSSSDAHEQAETIADMLRPLPLEEREAIVRFVGDAVRLFNRIT